MEFAFSVMRTKRFGRVVASAAACVLVMGLSWTAGAVERALTGPAAGTVGLPQPLFGGILLDLVDDINRWLATSAQVAQHAKRLQPAEGGARRGVSGNSVGRGPVSLAMAGVCRERSGRGATGRLL